MVLPRSVMELASRQGGYVTRVQLIRAGLSPSAVDRRIRSGELTTVSEATYRVFPSARHIDLMRGALLALPRAVVSHQSAAHLLQFPRLPTPVPTVTVASNTTHDFRGVMVRRCDDLAENHLTKVEGLAVTIIARTLFDLAGILVYREFDAIAEALLIDGRLRLPQLDVMTDQLARRGKRGSRAVRDFITIRGQGDPRASALERRGRAVLVSAGLPAPIPQYPVPWDPGRRFDDAYPEARLAIEWDSRAWHLQRTAMMADRRRDRLAAVHGWRVIRFTWEDVTENPRQVAWVVSSLLESQQLRTLG